MTRWFRLWRNGPGLVFHDLVTEPRLLFSVRNKLGISRYQIRIGRWLVYPIWRM